MSKQCLDVQQMKHLGELGLELSNDTLLTWIVDERGKDKSLLCVAFEAVDYVDFSHHCIPAYTLQDVLDALPDFIEEYCLIIDMSFGVIRYDNLTKRNNPILKETYFNDEDKSIIDAAYEMLCWAIENKFVGTNKNE